MADQQITEQPEALQRLSTAKTERTTVKLDEIRFDTDRYCHRDSKGLKEENLQPLMDSLTLEGLQVPIEFYLDGDKKILVKGHRRVTACRLLAEKNTPGFAQDMELEAIEVEGSLHDLLVRSVSDNDVRANLSPIERMQVVKKLHDNGITVQRAAGALGVSDKQYGRDLLIAKHGWMFEHVKDRSIAATYAPLLLDEATKAERLAELKEDVDAWIADKKKKLREKEKLLKAQGGKELRPADKEVKNLMPKHLVLHWVGLIRDGTRFDDDAKWNYDAVIEREKKQLRISAITMNLATAPVENVLKVAGKLSLLAKQLGPFIKERAEKESAGTSTDVEARYDADYARSLGLNDFADEWEAEIRRAQEQEPDGEDAVLDQVAAREEADLSQEVVLPEPSVKVPDANPPAATKKGGK